MDYYTPLWSGVVDSSLWDEPDPVVKVFVTMLAIKDPDFVVRKTAYQIGRCARKTEAEVLEALEVLSSPDTKRLEPQPQEGRRLERVSDGWLILNGKKYQEKMREEAERARWRKAQAAKREREKKPSFRSKMSKTPAEKQFEETGQMPDERPVNGEPPLQWDNEADS